MIAVITTFFNGDDLRVERLKAFREYINTFKVDLYVVEISNNGNFQVTQSDNVFDIQLASTENIWHKEAAINQAINRIAISGKYKYVAWLDSDIELFPSWVEATCKALKKYDVIQCFSKVVSLDSSGEIEWTANGIVPTKNGHGGFAWAAKIEKIYKVGLLDFCLHGNADILMANALLEIDREKLGLYNASPGFLNKLSEWKTKVKNFKIGFIEGVCTHYWHGDTRRYNTLWDKMCQFGFDPEINLSYSDNGLPVLINNSALKRELQLT